MGLNSSVWRFIRRAVFVPLVLTFAAQAQAQGAQPFSKEQLDQMTAPIALYPDSLLSQLLMATTYPDQFAQAYAWAKAHPDAKGDDAVKMVENENWDPSVASMVGFPEVLITLGDQPDWVKNMGDAFLAQPGDVMDSVQRLRAQAQKAGNLKSNDQIKVATEAAPPPDVSQAPAPQYAPPPQIITIQPAQPTVIYVPAYNPAVVYGPWLYPAYPPYYYPPPPGYWFSRTIATGIAWGVGYGVSNALWGGVNWHNHDVNINVNRYNNINVNKRLDVNGGTSNWHHNPQNRKADYRGGNATRQNLDKKYQAGNREQYRGKDMDRDASRARAQQTMQQRGVESPAGSARDRAQAMNKDAAGNKALGGRGAGDRDGARDFGSGGAGDRNGGRDFGSGGNRDAARAQVQGADRDVARQRAQSANRDNALSGANSGQARAQVDRGQASSRAASGIGGANKARAGGGGQRPAGAGTARAGGGGAGRPGGGGAGGGRGGGRKH